MKATMPAAAQHRDRKGGPGRRASDPPCAGARMLCLRPWRRRRDDPFLHGDGSQRPRRTRRGDLALSVSLYGERQQTAGPAGDRARRRARRGGGSRAMLSGPAFDRGRKIVRRPHDLAGAGGGAARRRSSAWRSWAFRCIRRASRPAIGPSTSPTSISRCCSCRAPAIVLRRWRCSNPWSNASGHRPRCISSTAPIIPFTCWRGRDATTATS